MRRRALMAASQPSGGGKPVNTLTLRPYSEWGELCVIFSFTFPPSSDLFVEVQTAGLLGIHTIYFLKGKQDGVKISVDIAESPQMQLLSFTPTEDDDYIYEIVIEY